MTLTNYSTPEMEQVSDVLGYANEYTNDAFVVMSLFAIWIILFAWFKRYETKVAVAGANTVTFVLSIPLAYIKFHGSVLLAPEVPVALLVLTGLSGIWLWKSDN